MGYAVKEVFYTLQGEGANAGRAAVFLRFTGCNLWSGREHDRERGPGGCARWCDTDFVGTDGTGGGRFDTPASLAAHVAARWPAHPSTNLNSSPTLRAARPLVVCTGGEPLLQLDDALCDALHAHGFEIAIETNGTLPVPRGVDWVCVSPKHNGTLVVHSGHELKFVFPQPPLDPARYLELAFQHFFLQPMDGPARAHNTALATAYCLEHPAWRLSLQTHKILNIP